MRYTLTPGYDITMIGNACCPSDVTDNGKVYIAVEQPDGTMLETEPEDIDMAVVGYVTRDTIVNIDESGERHPFHSVGGVSTYFSMVSSSLGHPTGIVSPVGDEFRADYLSPADAQRYGLSDDQTAELRTYVEDNQGDAIRLEKDLASKLVNKYGLADGDASELAHQAAYGSIFTPLHNKAGVNLDGCERKGDDNSEITVLVPVKGYTIGVVEHRLPAIKPEDVPDNYLGARGIHIGPLFGEVPLETVKYIHDNSDAVITLDAQGYIRHLTNFSKLEKDAVEGMKDNGATPEDRARWVTNDSELVTLSPWEEIGEFAKYVDVLKMNEFEAVTCAGIADEGDSRESVEKAMGLLEDKLAPQNKDLVLMVTMGGDGLLLSFEKHGRRVREYVRPAPATVVDTTGAGDTTAAAFLRELSNTHDVQWSSRFAASAGSLAVEVEGPFACPEPDAVYNRMADTYSRIDPADLETDSWLQYMEQVHNANEIGDVELTDGFSPEAAAQHLERTTSYLESLDDINWNEEVRGEYREALERFQGRLEERANS